MELEQLAARVWPGQHVSFEPLGGGITNRNFKARVAGRDFVLRIGGKDTELLGIDRPDEHAASCLAAELGLAPEVIAFLEPEGCLVTQYVDGVVGKPDPARVGVALRRLHGGPDLPGRFDCFRVVETYHATAGERGVVVPAEYQRAKEIADQIERCRSGAPLRPCHNDLLGANFIDDGARLWIVDWEYAGMGDPFFDLGNFAVNNELSEEEEQTLLSSYRTDDRHALMMMRFMSDFREAMWGVVQLAISELDFDFAAYAQQHFDRLAQTATEPRFAAALRG